MVEEAHACECHSDAVLVAGFNNMVVTHGTTCLRYVFYTALVRTFDVITEGEECV